MRQYIGVAVHTLKPGFYSLFYLFILFIILFIYYLFQSTVVIDYTLKTDNS